jgi:hypothetical protein
MSFDIPSTFDELIHEIEAFYFKSGYRGRSFHALNIESCDSMSDSLDFLSRETDQNYPKASIAIIAIKHFSLLYNLDIKQIDLRMPGLLKPFPGIFNTKGGPFDIFGRI